VGKEQDRTYTPWNQNPIDRFSSFRHHPRAPKRHRRHQPHNLADNSRQVRERRAHTIDLGRRLKSPANLLLQLLIHTWRPTQPIRQSTHRRSRRLATSNNKRIAITRHMPLIQPHLLPQLKYIRAEILTLALATVDACLHLRLRARDVVQSCLAHRRRTEDPDEALKGERDVRDGAGVRDEDYHVEDCGDPFAGLAGGD